MGTSPGPGATMHLWSGISLLRTVPFSSYQQSPVPNKAPGCQGKYTLCNLLYRWAYRVPLNYLQELAQGATSFK